MIDRNPPVTEDELHVYVDGELAPDRREAVENWLANHPDEAARVAAWRAQAEAIRARFGAVVEEQVPSRLALERITRNRRSWIGAAAAAVLLAFVTGGGVGWVARGASAEPPPSDSEVFADAALAAHRLYVAEMRHPIEVTAGEDHLVRWLSRRVGTSLRAPELDAFGYKLMGGRLLPGQHGPAALFMYEASTGERLTLYCTRQPAAQTALRYHDGERFNAAYWVENGFGFVVSGTTDRVRLGKIARKVYEQMELHAPARDQTSIDQLISRRGS